MRTGSHILLGGGESFGGLGLVFRWPGLLVSVVHFDSLVMGVFRCDEFRRLD